ncbi:hypothetical protein OUQ99_31485 (plasmid) [Streptomonospora nanhaiensis]|uniref:Uncharacterized protein n=1 Tax=Streptomonospora nanhaiensis TaxID=1323731 RepID=A0ABY6YXK5_9ACTN|nr:hypothetical protein [Streptomonospora nanhaiensis]WAE76833.1 hypothetical protein OUQ99_31485 [Streptomonospora nanhaiensis]
MTRLEHPMAQNPQPSSSSSSSASVSSWLRRHLGLIVAITTVISPLVTVAT